ncbi:MAG: hypothetical protein JW880_06825 [Candidatus Thermoplasmatota archaeon]|nr:hypothetical protein [Candidatus Thermoplasmatota archaeon]
MPLNLKFFYLANQCPHNCYLLARVKTIAWRERIPLHLFDIWNDPATCEKYRIFSPTMLIVNDKYRLHGPFTAERVIAMLSDEGVEPREYSVRQGDDVVRGELAPITPESVLETAATCAGADDAGLCMGKSEWVQEVLRTTGLKHLGYTHAHDGKCVGGAEFLPSTLVPYPIPDKRESNAFLTCSYLSDERKDYKTHPLERLSQDLKTWGFDTLSVAASKDVVFPNGPMSWFEKKGFTDKGTLITEELHKAKIHYLQMSL